MDLLTKASYSDGMNQREKDNLAVAYQAACEGMVLLKNDGALPFPTKRVALYGAGAAMTVKGGTGSGFMLRLDNFFGELKMSFDGDTWRVTTADQEQWVADMMARLLGESAGT